MLDLVEGETGIAIHALVPRGGARLNRETPSVAFDDLVRDGQTETGPGVRRLRGEERLGGAGGILRCDARTIVRDDERDLMAVRPAGDVDRVARLASPRTR